MNKYIEKRQFNNYCYKYQNFIENGKLNKEWIEKYIIGKNKLKQNAINAFFQAEYNVILNNIKSNNFEKNKHIIDLFNDINNDFVNEKQLKIKNIILENT